MSSKQKNNNNIFPSNLPIPLFLILCLYPPHVTAQPSPPSSPPYTDFNPSIIAIIVILVAALFLMAFFSIYIRRHATDATSVIMQRTGTIRGSFHGLDSSVIDTFPTFVYSTVKGLKIGKGALECAVCLNEYEDDEMLRLIPKCDHVFHPDCIDAWFKSHVTCPVCRANLVPDSEQNESVSVSVSVVVDDPTVNVHEPESLNTLNPLNRDQSVVKPGVFDKFRSHSTGHSLGENMERFTLRLPEDVRKQVVNRGLLNRVGESSGKKGFRTGGGVSGRRRSYKRLESVAVRSERWVLPRAPSFLTRAFSIRSPRVVSGNPEPSASSRTADNIPLNNIGPKSC